jgi:hypothetical protein
MRSHRALHKLDIFHRSCVYRRFLHGIYSCYTVWSLDCYNRRTVPYLHLFQYPCLFQKKSERDKGVQISLSAQLNHIFRRSYQ